MYGFLQFDRALIRVQPISIACAACVQKKVRPGCMHSSSNSSVDHADQSDHRSTARRSCTATERCPDHSLLARLPVRAQSVGCHPWTRSTSGSSGRSQVTWCGYTTPNRSSRKRSSPDCGIKSFWDVPQLLWARCTTTWSTATKIIRASATQTTHTTYIACGAHDGERDAGRLDGTAPSKPRAENGSLG
eukprot:SAG11_NODE_353_length_10348_cov_6.938335_1_plen_189_part_00